MAMVGEAVWSVGGFVDGVAWSLRHGIAKHSLKLLVGHGAVGSVEMVEELHFGIGALHECERIHKPRIAQCGRVELCSIGIHLHPTRVEHVEHLHIVAADLTVDQIIVARQFCRMVAAHSLVEI